MTDERVHIRVLDGDYQTIKSYCQSNRVPIIRFVEHVAGYTEAISAELSTKEANGNQSSRT